LRPNKRDRTPVARLACWGILLPPGSRWYHPGAPIPSEGALLGGELVVAAVANARPVLDLPAAAVLERDDVVRDGGRRAPAPRADRVEREDDASPPAVAGAVATNGGGPALLVVHLDGGAAVLIAVAARDERGAPRLPAWT